MAGSEHSVEVAVPLETARQRWSEFVGGASAGEARFEPLGEDRTRVTVASGDAPSGLLDLERFKALAEGTGAAEGIGAAAGAGTAERGGAYSAPGDAGTPLSEEGTTTGTSPGTPGEFADPDAGGPNPPPRREQPGL